MINTNFDVSSDEELSPMTSAMSPNTFAVKAAQQVQKGGLGGLKLPPPKPLTASEIQQLAERNEDLKEGMNRETAKLVTAYFVAMGFALTIAGGSAVLGYLRHDASGFLDGNTKITRNKAEVLAGFNSFGALQESCCCLQSTHPSSSYNVTERWVCPTKRVTLDRGRLSADLQDNGLLLRPVCGYDFQFGCALVVNNSDVSLRCEPEVSRQEWTDRGVTQDALRYLY